MFVRIDNVPRDYAWGSTHGIADLLGRPATGGPQAELWLGAHPASPSFLVHPHPEEGEGTLADLIARDPVGTLGEADATDPSLTMQGSPRLGFLLKVLSAAAPLSIQAHPSSEQARAGFARENSLGIPLDAPERNYKDPFHKPELLFAVTPFDALCGFRAVTASLAVIEKLIITGKSERLPNDELHVLHGLLAEGETDEAALRASVGLLLGGGDAADEIVAQATAIARSPQGLEVEEFDVVRRLADACPGDPGVMVGVLLNRVALSPGEALYLPAGNIHAYLRGTGIELMAASDNVLRGGLTPKHIDVPELLRVLDFEPVPAPFLKPSHVGAIELFEPDVPDFRLAHVTADASPDPAPSDASLALAGPAIVLCTAGAASLEGSTTTDRLTRGEIVFVSPDEGPLRFELDPGSTLFVATDNR